MRARILAALAAVAFAAGPAEAAVLTYSGYLLDPAGKPVTTSTTLQFRFYAAPTGGTIAWEDAVTVVPTADGWFSAVIGASAANPLAAADFSQALWLALKVSTDAQEMSPRQQLGTAPYALTVGWDGVQGKPATFPVDPALVQSRVTGTCGPGQFMTGVDQAGAVACGVDTTGAGDVTGVVAGSGLAGGGLAGDVSLAVDTAAIQSRVRGSCPPGNAVRSIAADGTVVCEPDDDTTYGAGDGILLVRGGFATDNAVVARKDAVTGNQTFGGGTLQLDYVNGRVGVNTTLPQAPLDVAGAVRASDYTLAAPRAGKVYVPGASFVKDEAIAHGWFGGSAGFGYIGSPGQPLYMVMLTTPLNLPHGATLTGLFCQIFDGDTANLASVDAVLYRRAFSSTTAQQLARATGATTAAGASAALTNVATSTFAVPIVDSLNYGHHLLVMFEDTPNVSFNLRLYGCGVDYTVSSLD